MIYYVSSFSSVKENTIDTHCNRRSRTRAPQDAYGRAPGCRRASRRADCGQWPPSRDEQRLDSRFLRHESIGRVVPCRFTISRLDRSGFDDDPGFHPEFDQITRGEVIHNDALFQKEVDFLSILNASE